jgi:release factor glutamine methyltransferase
MGIDISAEALSVAGSQKFDMPAGSKAPEFVRADVLDTSKAASFGKFDAILSNPPYIMEKEKASMRVNVLDYEPASALFVSDSDPLVFYRAIAEWSLAALVPGGFGITEINQELGSETLEIFTSKGFSAGLVKDFRGNFRFISYSK